MISIATISELQFLMLKEAAISRAIAEAQRGMTMNIGAVGHALPICFLSPGELLPFLNELHFTVHCRIEHLKKDLVSQGG